MDELFIPILGIRMGKIGVVCVLQDWGRSEGVQEPNLIAARAVPLHPTQFREVYGRLNYMTKASWKNLVHPIVGGQGTATVLAASPGDFAGSFDVQEFSALMATIWQVPVETIFKDGFGCSTLFDDSGRPFSAPSHDLIFPRRMAKQDFGRRMVLISAGFNQPMRLYKSNVGAEEHG